MAVAKTESMCICTTCPSNTLFRTCATTKAVRGDYVCDVQNSSWRQRLKNVPGRPLLTIFEILALLAICLLVQCSQIWPFFVSHSIGTATGTLEPLNLRVASAATSPLLCNGCLRVIQFWHLLEIALCVTFAESENFGFLGKFQCKVDPS